jgi:glycosyltransferase involved in cell wall biosynthesis
MKSVSFIYLSAFASHGGIEKFNRALIKALETSAKARIYSLYDQRKEVLTSYWKNKKLFFGVAGGRLTTTLLLLLRQCFRKEALIFGHINLAPLGLILAYFGSSRKLILVAHGIEMWEGITPIKRKFINRLDEVWAVSNYTKNKLLADFPALEGKVKVFPNTLDPEFPEVEPGERSVALLRRYQLKEEEKVILTIARVSSQEGYKGYDRVVEALAVLKNTAYKYLIAGKYDQEEKDRVIRLARKLGVEKQVQFLGFVKEEELIAHYQLANVFVMPSDKEGFGIVFIEALACGTPVIAGDKDGSVDALDNGRLGKLVDPKSVTQIASALKKQIEAEPQRDFNQQAERIKAVRAIFGFESFQHRLSNNLREL